MKMQADYILKVGQSGRERLEILNKLVNPSTQQFLLDSGLQKGMTVLEVGCGTGEMACWFAKQVGPTGKVFAVDQSEHQIEVSNCDDAQRKNAFGDDNCRADGKHC